MSGVMRIPCRIAPLAAAEPRGLLSAGDTAAAPGLCAASCAGGGPPVSRSVGVKGAPAPEPLDVVVSPPPGAIWFDAELIELPAPAPVNISFNNWARIFASP